jgi:hypothetical protein
VAPVVERREAALARGNAPVRQLPVAPPPVATTAPGALGGIRF